ncbi:protein S100-A1-like protein [Lates japonicus]|uniref:Protein S100-A1-like protein n=1 Tax=Lates japonicus TaxID=270547 RepID=A0AAD3MEX3_LATJO|nr:protein S100-A1-like protein [Lates japonicus]
MRVRVGSASEHPLILVSSFVQTLLAAMCSTASQLETAMDTLIKVFQCYSSREGDRFKLNFVELRSLLRVELNLEGSWDSGYVEMIMADLDKNNDCNVSFEEFVVLLTHLTVRSKPFFRDYKPVIIQCGQIRDGRFQM